MTRSQQQVAMGIAVVTTILVIKLLILAAVFGWF